MFFRWFKRRRRRQLRVQPFPEPWWRYLRNNFAYYARLSVAQQSKLRGDLRVFVAEKNWEGCGGLTVNDQIKVTIAAQACLLTLGFDEVYFDHVLSILVYPQAYIAPGTEVSKGGVILEGDSARSGEAWYRGPVIVSWEDALAGGRRHAGGSNLVFHEFAHQLDMLNGRVVDGTPRLTTRNQYRRWQQVITAEYHRHERDCQQGRATLLDPYGSNSLGEFFAVVVECFFTRPRRMLRHHSELYATLRNYFRQDPAAWAHGSCIM